MSNKEVVDIHVYPQPDADSCIVRRDFGWSSEGGIESDPGMQLLPHTSLPAS
jgi:hypothetical protein